MFASLFCQMTNFCERDATKLLYSKTKLIQLMLMTAAQRFATLSPKRSGVGYLRWGGDGEAVQPEKG